MTIAKSDKFIDIISLAALRGQIMTVKVHSGLCMKYIVSGDISYNTHKNKHASPALATAWGDGLCS